MALVESEKTAVICACINPDCVWLATGGKGQLNDRVEVLTGRKVIAVPDVDGYDTWVRKAAERPQLGIIVSDLLEKNATPEDRAAHIDIFDLLIRYNYEELFETLDFPHEGQPNISKRQIMTASGVDGSSALASTSRRSSAFQASPHHRVAIAPCGPPASVPRVARPAERSCQMPEDEPASFLNPTPRF